MNKLKPEKNPSRHPEGEIYALDPSKMMVGDIVLMSGPGMPSRLIRSGTGSSFSHAAVLTQPGMLLEAQPEGVRRRSPWGTHAIKREWIQVRRPKVPIKMNDRGVSLSQCAETRYGWGYSLIRAGGSLWPSSAEMVESLEGTFCSEMVALAFADYGVDLLPGVRCSQVTPGMLTKSKLLSDVTESCIRVLHPVRDANEFRMVTNVHERDDPKYEMTLERKCFEKLRARQILPTSMRSLHEAFVWLSDLDMTEMTDALIDNEFFKILEEEGYFNFYEAVALEIGFGARPFSQAMGAAQTLRLEDFNPDIQMLLSDLERMLPTFEQSFDARIASYEKSLTLQLRGSKTLFRWREVQERLLAQALMLRQSRHGLIAALQRVASK